MLLRVIVATSPTPLTLMRIFLLQFTSWTAAGRVGAAATAAAAAPRQRRRQWWPPTRRHRSFAFTRSMHTKPLMGTCRSLSGATPSPLSSRTWRWESSRRRHHRTSTGPVWQSAPCTIRRRWLQLQRRAAVAVAVSGRPHRHPLLQRAPCFCLAKAGCYPSDAVFVTCIGETAEAAVPPLFFVVSCGPVLLVAGTAGVACFIFLSSCTALPALTALSSLLTLSSPLSAGPTPYCHSPSPLSPRHFLSTTPS